MTASIVTPRYRELLDGKISQKEYVNGLGRVTPTDPDRYASMNGMELLNEAVRLCVALDAVPRRRRLGRDYRALKCQGRSCQLAYRAWRVSAGYDRLP